MTDNDMDKISVQLPDFFETNSSAFDRSFSEPSTGSSFVCDMIPPLSPKSAKQKSLRISHALQQCENTLFPSKKKLMLANLDLSASDIPLTKLCGTTLGMTLHKLSLAGNWLGTVPFELVQQLPVLKHLDLSQCKLSQLPEIWNLPKLRRLNLSHNKFTLFPEEVRQHPIN